MPGLCEFVPTTMLRFGGIFLVSLCSLMLKILGFISKYVYRPKQGHVVEENGSSFSASHSQKDDQVVSKKSTVALSSWLVEKESFELQRSKDSCGNISVTEDSAFFERGLVASTSESGAQSLDCEISPRKDSLDLKLEKSSQEFDEESDSSSFGFELFLNSSCSANEVTCGHNTSELEHSSEKKADRPSKSPCTEKIYEENENLNSAESKNLGIEGKDSAEDGIMEDQDFSYEVELLPQCQFSPPGVNQSSDAAGSDILISSQKIESNDEDFLDGNNEATLQRKHEDNIADHDIDHAHLAIRDSVLSTERMEDLDDEYIELEPLSMMNLTDICKESFGCGDANRTDELHDTEIMRNEGLTSAEDIKENKNFWDSDSDDDDDESDVLWEHQHLVQQMKNELKNCKLRGLPTISEECETPRMVEDLKPLKIDLKFEYKDIMEEIQMFYKSYAEKMRKLDILNYQTLHAISFLQLKDSEVFTTGSKKSASASFNWLRIWPRKIQRIYADPVHKSIMDMQHDLEFVYVGQLCLSWEILCWLYVKAQELMEYDCKGHHSYNRVAEEYQQFQVLMHRFMEDEPFQGPRILNYVKSRCIVRSLLQVPTIKDDCLKDKKERIEEKDTISLELIVQIIRESMLIFQEFLCADKGTAIHRIKVDLHEIANSVLLEDIITNLKKKDRRIREHKRSKNCIVSKLQKHQKGCLNHELLTSQVELRLVSRVLILSTLTTDQLVWCQQKLSNISVVGRRVHVEPSFLLFPC